ncbi:Putative invasin [Edwardsiella anguillarum]|nr:hypothetical protein QY76_16165 [Edwardsiella sp. EA181011]BET80031.1 Putative invasin [Edwardsiella anguillarum]BET83320.1 Putative invasin [Edwardsiella anguillarum]BET86687.1 Putative invasin [Edwardsiella anguillarum]BET90113.1 Putative invasin [Edwardsiella anguillarum]
MQAGRILSSENIKNLSINYAESIGEDLIKEKINAWANQKGTVRINASFDNKISGDVLLPITESSDGLLFSQFGLHASVGNSRYVNIGVGYRKHINNWMYGVNTFYDYSYAGKHARAGIGGEMWADYMKLAVNGYYGLTDWHESRLSAMKDYDERPASGFDLRAEAYLPSYPQLGASLKYEQYFGEGVRLNIGSHADDLKDNPKALTFGLSYTPIPLITLKGEYSGGRKDASRIGINVNYRFGVPWAQQISIDGVKVLRSLMGSSYELVDRNNEIVMQYRKQDLLEISLPNTVTAEAAETITLPLTVSKDKYGLRDVKWTASVEFFANGGSFRKLSLTQLEVTLPSYLYTKLANTAQEYVIKAVGVDNNGNNSNPAATTIKVKPADAASAKIYALTADKDVAVDNGKDTITFTTVVRDVAGAVVPGVKVTLAATSGTLSKNTVTTDDNGVAYAKLTDTAAENVTVTATTPFDTKGKTASVTFKADAASAKIYALTADKDVAVDNGKDAITFTTVVRDVAGAVVPGVKVTLAATSGTLSKNTVTTDDNGVAYAKLTDTAAENVTVTATTPFDTKGKTASVTFKADAASAKIYALTADKDVAVDNGKDAITFTTVVRDVAGAVVPGVKVTLATTSGTLSKNTVTTDDNGVAYAKLTDTAAENVTVTATTPFDTKGKTASVTFKADAASAKIYALTADKDVAVDNGKDAITFTTVVRDVAGAVVPGVKVTLATTSGTLSKNTVTTDDNGVAYAKLTDTAAENVTVTATTPFDTKGKTASVTFKADAASAKIYALTADKDVAVDNGKDAITFTTVVRDVAGAVVPGVKVTLAATSGTLSKNTVTTDDNGVAYAKLTDTAAENVTVTATTPFDTKGKTASVTFKADAASAKIYALTADKEYSTDQIAFTAQVKDKSNQNIPNENVYISSSSGFLSSRSKKTDKNGIVRFTLTDDVLEEITVQVRTNFDIYGKTKVVHFSPFVGEVTLRRWNDQCHTIHRTPIKLDRDDITIKLDSTPVPNCGNRPIEELNWSLAPDLNIIASSGNVFVNENKVSCDNGVGDNIITVRRGSKTIMKFTISCN